MDLAARLEVVEAENETLRARVANLEAALVGGGAFPADFNLTASEARVLGHLASREMGTKGSIMSALYIGRIDDEPDPKIVDVFICKLRRKLKGFPVTIETVWGQGYAIPEEGRAWLRDRMLKVSG